MRDGAWREIERGREHADRYLALELSQSLEHATTHQLEGVARSAHAVRSRTLVCGIRDGLGLTKDSKFFEQQEQPVAEFTERVSDLLSYLSSW
ncbi:MAG: hypothetical protein EXR75_08450 [Myxococcales bacterium]|nr:hypothetical protein [Myxococcales bacterium]